MLFLWSRESSVIPPSPRAGPWFAWFATAVLVWRCRRRIASAIFGDSSSSRRKRAHLIRPFRPQKFQKHAENTLSRRQQQHQEMRHEMSVVKSRLKRLNAGDGPHMIKTTRKLARGANYVRISQQVYYRMTRSGRVYGKYPTKSTTAAIK
ncbi:hypothetical protein QAD02_004142 [Eretmocerus hayati]|uniref:Uncharacterized protein n=1 Tax=Eretmocerus hayati TaxID=131215 RepID=A0ACC2NQJ2_9HYME|nr:hypothetical protein QAD02_004142 [Eretmocerus hayati]